MWEVRNITDDDIELFRKRIDRAFGGDTNEDPEAIERFKMVFANDRTFAAFDGEDIIGTGGALSFDLTVPGGNTVAMGGTTIISVQPTHRRRGVLRALMTAHLDEVAGRSEPVAALWASESSIYSRFGYGPSTYRHRVNLATKRIRMRDASIPGSVRLLEAEEAEPLMHQIYEGVRITRSGMLSRSDGWWHARHIHENERGRDGKSKRRYAVYFEGEKPLGYATFRQKSHWEDFMPGGEVELGEVITMNNDAHRSLWSFLTNIDLFTDLEWWNVAIDDPLPDIITDPRQVKRTLADGMWVRIMDVAVALESRSYETDGSTIIEVSDDYRPSTSGVFEVVVEGGEAKCVATDQEPEVSMGIDVLGHLYLGGGSAVTMAAAGRLAGSTESVVSLHRLFTTAAAPWCPEVF